MRDFQEDEQKKSDCWREREERRAREGKGGEGRGERIGAKVLALSITDLGLILSSIIYGSSNIELY